MQTVSPTTSDPRLDLVRLGQADRPWEFLSRAFAWFHDNPDDHGVRFLAASNAAGLGLRTLATECLAPLPEEAASDERVRALTVRIAALPDDEMRLDTRLAFARRNVEALQARGIDLSCAHAEWASQTANERWFVSIDGNVVRVLDMTNPLGSCLWLSDLRGESRAFCETTVECDGYQAPAPFVVEGINPPWILVGLAERLKPTRTGYRTPIHVVQADLTELLDGLACVDLHDTLLDPRLHPHLGQSAAQLLHDCLMARGEHELPGRVVISPTATVRATPDTRQALHSLKSDQVASLALSAQQARSVYEPRDPSWWAKRFGEINNGTGAPLRALLITSRYTTFVQHSASDLAQAVQAAGGEARVLIEPDDATRMSKLAHLQAIVDFEPDLLVMINYTRAHLGAEVPPNLPVVCWIQDAMGHLFSPEAGAAQGPFDVLLGNYHSELFHRHGYEPRRYLHAPVAASETKFHTGPCTSHQQGRFACEVAYVSHHSETPDRMLQRLKDEAAQPDMEGLLDAVFPAVQDQLTRLTGEPIRFHLRQRLSDLAQHHLGAAPPPRMISELLDQVAIPLAERIIRHQTLEWAADVSKRRGWSLQLYGNGWDTHPSLSAHARGPLQHGDDLRACYQLAKVHLHASVSPLTHQRLMECVLSGGFPLATLNHDAVITPERAIAALNWRPPPEVLVAGIDPDPANLAQYGDRCRLRDQAVGYRVTEHPSLLRRTAQIQRLGEFAAGTDDVMWCESRRVRMNLELRACGLLDWNAAALFGDLADHAATDRQGFERLLVTAVENPKWRARRSAAVANRVKSYATHSALISRLTKWMPTTL